MAGHSMMMCGAGATVKVKLGIKFGAGVQATLFWRLVLSSIDLRSGPFNCLSFSLRFPVLFWLIHRQIRMNTLATACWGYGVFLLIFFYGSRFLNENYLGYILPFLAIGILADEG